MEMKEIFYVTFYQVNDKGQKRNVPAECETQRDVGRAIITFKPTRNYTLVGVQVTKEMKLV